MPVYQQKKARANTLARIIGLRQSAPLNKSSSPDVELIRTLKERTLAATATATHPMFRLSIEDFENMCKDDEKGNKIRIMALLLDTTIGKLKKICKKLHIFKEYINSSPESIKIKMKEYKAPILTLPEELQENIVNIFEGILKYELRDWIPIDKLDWDNLVYNPNAIDLLDANPGKINWGNLPSNSNNEGSVFLLRKYVFGNPKYKKFVNDIDWIQLSSNPYAIDLLETKIKEGGADAIEWAVLSSNPSAIDLLTDKWEEDKRLKVLDIEQYNNLKDYENIVAWNILSGNPKAIDLLRKKIREEMKMKPEEYDLLEDNEKIAWANLSENPEAIDLLEKNKDKIVWLNLSANTNPKAMKLLKDRVEYESSLSIEEYRKLSNKVNWLYLSNNPNAIKILKENIDKIVWTGLSNNLEAINLLKANPDKIVWEVLSGNPEAMSLLEANQDKINWEVLSRNPKAMSLLEANQDKIVWKELSLNSSIFILR